MAGLGECAEACRAMHSDVGAIGRAHGAVRLAQRRHRLDVSDLDAVAPRARAAIAATKSEGHVDTQATERGGAPCGRRGGRHVRSSGEPAMGSVATVRVRRRTDSSAGAAVESREERQRRSVRSIDCGGSSR